MRGRLYGPAIFPLAFGCVQEIIAAGVPVIAAGGMYEQVQVEALLEAGAIGVQLDAVLWSFRWQGERG